MDFVITLYHAHPVIAVLAFIVLRGLAIMIPFLPGWPMDLAAITLFGWLPACIYAEIGIMFGSTVAFLIARYARRSILSPFFRSPRVERWQAAIARHQTFWGFTSLRIIFNPFFDYLSYAAGLSTISFRLYVSATFVGSLVSIFIIYYLSGYVLAAGWEAVLICMTIGFSVWFLTTRRRAPKVV